MAFSLFRRKDIPVTNDQDPLLANARERFALAESIWLAIRFGAFVGTILAAVVLGAAIVKPPSALRMNW